MITRVNLILRTKNLSPSQFADEIGVQRSSMSHILSGRNNPSLEFITKVLSRFPELETDWLIFGKGPMYKDSQTQEKSVKQSFDNTNQTVEQDLFSQQLIQESVEEKSTTVIPVINTIDEKRETEEKTVEIEESINENAIKMPNTTQNNFYANLKEVKTIEKFVILYTDKTFCEYYPE